MKDKMKFKTAYKKLLEGHRIKRVPWGGYWQWENDTIMMHCKDGKVLDIRQTKDVAFTIGNINCSDWEIATPENCELLKKEKTKLDILFESAQNFIAALKDAPLDVDSVSIKDNVNNVFEIKVKKYSAGKSTEE